ncbi:MFS transporter [Kitasatospora sp. NPDC096147]|uniref:MFS transporter n=1 Tax=Kitasatospora sp. NPDC096147 TaxID=3364093 RepID=UPI0038287EAB
MSAAAAPAGGPPGGWTPYVLRFFSYGTWGVLYPFLPVWLLAGDRLTAGQTGLVVGGAVLANRLGSLLFVKVLRPGSERAFVIGSQLVMAAVAGALCLAGLAGLRAVGGWLLLAVVFGLAGSLATLAQLTLIVHQFDPAQTRSAFSYENIALNAAGGLAPLLSSLVLTVSEPLYPLAPLPFALVGVVLATRLAVRPGPPPAAAGATAQRRAARPVVAVLLAANFLTTLAYAQFYGVFSAYATPELGVRRIGLLFAVASVAIVALQSLVTRWTRGLGEPALVLLANLAMAAGTGLLVAVGTGMPVLLVAVLAITLGEMVYGPVYQTLAVNVSGGRPALAIGALTFVWGVAESLAVVAGLALVGAGLGPLSFLGGALGCLAVVALVTAGRRHFAAMAVPAEPSADGPSAVDPSATGLRPDAGAVEAPETTAPAPVHS